MVYGQRTLASIGAMNRHTNTTLTWARTGDDGCLAEHHAETEGTLQSEKQADPKTLLTGVVEVKHFSSEVRGFA